MGRFDGQVIFISGAGTGLGRGLMAAYLAEGAKVGTIEVVPEKVDALLGELPAADVSVVHGDVQQFEDNERAIVACVEKFGRLDAFIQCAAITDWTPAFTLLPTDKMSQAFNDIMRINVLGAAFGALAAAKELKKTKGSMVFTLSTSGYFPGGQGAIYTLSKHALNGLVRQLAYELAPDVRVNGVVPGAIQESRLRGPQVLDQQDLYPESAFPEMQQMIEGMTPLHVYAKASDYAPIYMLLTDREAARVVSGSMVFWDSGISIVGHGSALKDALDAAENA